MATEPTALPHARERQRFCFVLTHVCLGEARTDFVLRLVDLALRRGHDVSVFAYGGEHAAAPRRAPEQADGADDAVLLPGRPLPRQRVIELMVVAARHGATLDWIDCGPYASSHGLDGVTPVRAAHPRQFWKHAVHADNALFVGTD